MLARRQASGRFTYGLQGASIVAALANALLLFAATIGIGWEAMQRLQHPEPIATNMVIWVALAGVVVNGVTAWMLSRDSHDLNIRAAFLHMAADAAISLGVAFSALITRETGWLWLDAVTSLAIVAVIAYSTWGLFREAMLLTLNAAPANVDMTQVRAALGQMQGVKEVHDLHVWAISTSGTALSAHLVMPGGHPGDAFLHEALHMLEERFHIGHATLQIELGADIHLHNHVCDHAH
jgi:cobalt-zinc-cadmium efflux system protein